MTRSLRIAAVAVAAGSLLAVGSTLAACGEGAELEQPVPLFDDVSIEYPLGLWDEGVEGTTILRVRVDETGGVDSTVVAESSGYDAFDSAALQGAGALRFEPATRDGEPTSVWARVPVHFSRDSTIAPDTGSSGASPSDSVAPEPSADGGAPGAARSVQ